MRRVWTNVAPQRQNRKAKEATTSPTTQEYRVPVPLRFRTGLAVSEAISFTVVKMLTEANLWFPDLWRLVMPPGYVLLSIVMTDRIQLLQSADIQTHPSRCVAADRKRGDNFPRSQLIFVPILEAAPNSLKGILETVGFRIRIEIVRPECSASGSGLRLFDQSARSPFLMRWVTGTMFVAAL